MIWPFELRKQRVDVRQEPQLQFTGEQDGVPEQSLKKTLIPILAARRDITRAYLVRVMFPPSTSCTVVLAIRSNSSADPELVQTVAQAFAEQFQREANLDIMFMTETQEIAAAQVCRPFYPAA